MSVAHKWLNKIRWDEHGLVPVIAQEAGSGHVLMFAWMNRDALAETAKTGVAVYWSRSRKKLWRKGEESGHVQKVQDIRL
ncbi:MAG: Phosphoribosyl-AMP cyclohydrolase, partial [Burkholderiaceae bacterium]|nr:Phosphoribosyl-AMP cyclohydrolase [Burkholderiaceae bacterium]